MLSIWRDRIVHPCGLTTSNAQFPALPAPAATSATSRKPTRFLLGSRTRLLRSHQSSVDFAIPSLWQNARRVLPLRRKRSTISSRSADLVRLSVVSLCV